MTLAFSTAPQLLRHSLRRAVSVQTCCARRSLRQAVQARQRAQRDSHRRRRATPSRPTEIARRRSCGIAPMRSAAHKRRHWLPRAQELCSRHRPFARHPRPPDAIDDHRRTIDRASRSSRCRSIAHSHLRARQSSCDNVCTPSHTSACAAREQSRCDSAEPACARRRVAARRSRSRCLLLRTHARSCRTRRSDTRCNDDVTLQTKKERQKQLFPSSKK